MTQNAPWDSEREPWRYPMNPVGIFPCALPYWSRDFGHSVLELVDWWFHALWFHALSLPVLMNVRHSDGRQYWRGVWARQDEGEISFYYFVRCLGELEGA